MALSDDRGSREFCKFVEDKNGNAAVRAVMMSGDTEGLTPVSLATAQTITGAWADLGSEITTKGYNVIGLWIDLNINDSTNVRFRCLLKHTSAGADEFSLPILTAGASSIAAEVEYVELNVDADQKLILSWDLDCVVPYVQFQVMAGAAGASPGIVTTAYYIKGYK